MAAKGNCSSVDDDDEDDRSLENQQQPASQQKKKGTILGAVLLIVGTSIGSGILALPEKTSPAGFIPSAIAITLCWLFLVVEALILAEINVNLRKRWKKDDKEGSSDELEVVSLRTMAQETLGEWGGNLATVTYLFLAYTSIVAYTSKSGDVLSQLIGLPDSVSGIIFTLLLALLILLGGTRTTDRVNQWLTISMIGLLLAIEIMALSFGGWSDSLTVSNWSEVPQTIPVIIFSLVYHDIAPVICAYLGGDIMRIRVSILLGSIIPLLTLLIWDGIAIDLDEIDHLNVLLRGRWNNMLPIVEVFSILAVGTSLIGTLLGFSQFFMEQFAGILHSSPSWENGGRDWLRRSKLAVFATSMAVLPPVLISTIVPDAFSVATDVAGGYCMTILYGVIPPAMAWALQTKLDERSSNTYKAEDLALCNVKPVVIVVGILSCGIVMEQLLQDLRLVELG